MKTLLLIRHAKSSWDNPAMDDHERPLNKRGLKTAPRMGQLIADEGLKPDIIVSSTAVRAATTAEVIAEECGYDRDIQFTDDLYLAPPSAYLDLLSTLPDDYNSAMLVGHNPGISELVSSMCGEHVDMPTAALAHTQSENQSWKAFETSSDADLVNFWRPKELGR
ncbi:MAG: histidine phosphatase family protein [Planctomycetaceae bacterium]